jgi:hypothetical protein
VLPQIVSQIANAKKQQEEARSRRLDLQIKYTQADPEIQALLKQNPDFVREVSGRADESPLMKFVHRNKPLPNLPVRDLTTDELAERRKRLVDTESAIQNQDRVSQLMDATKQEMQLAGIKLDAIKRVTGVTDNQAVLDKLPAEDVTIQDYVVGLGVNVEEASRLYVAKKHPDLVEQMTQYAAGVGPEVVNLNRSKYFKQCTDDFGVANQNCLLFSDALAENNPSKLAKITDLGMKTLAYQKYKQDQLEAIQTMQRFQVAHQETIGTTALRIMEQNPAVDPALAHDMSRRLTEGTPLTKEQEVLGLDWAKLKAESAAATARKIQYDSEVAPLNGLSNALDQNLKILQQAAGASGGGISADMQKLSYEQVQKIAPELAKRVAKQYGLVDPAGKKPVPGWFQTYVVDYLKGAAGLAKSVTASDTPVPYTSPSGSVIRTAAKDAGIAFSAGLDAAVSAISGAVRIPGGPSESQLAWTIGKAFMTPEGKKAPAVKAPALSQDETTHLENLTREITMHLSDPNTPVTVLQAESDVLDLLQDIKDGKRPYTDLFNVKP